MAPDDDFDRSIQALLDGRSLTEERGPALPEAVRVMDAIARAHRTALFGRDVPPDRPSPTRWGHLEIRGEIGRGANGTVYSAWDTRLDRVVALKLLAPDAAFSGAALAEGRLLARLDHPHIVKVFGADTHDGVAGIWMEFIEGESLDDILSRDGVFGPEEALLIGLDLARALSAVHAAGMLHRDVKARNVLREWGGRVVLMDLGSGRVADRVAGSADQTGTPIYMAPEVLAGEPATPRSDTYCLGVLLYRLLTGTYPVGGSNLERLRLAHAAGGRRALSSLRPDIDNEIVMAIERGCHPDPAERYASAGDMEVALEDAFRRMLERRTVVASALTRAWGRWRRPLLVVAAVIAAVSAFTWSAWDTSGGRSARRALALPVWPRSPLYLALNGAIGIVRGGELSLVPYNPPSARAIAVSTDQGILTMAGVPPFTEGGRFRLDGTPFGAPSRGHAGLCCWMDGTTDGRFNYSARQDSTLLEPIGSRPLAPASFYRFDRDWSNPQLLFPLAPDGVYYGVAYSAASDTFWLTRAVSGRSVIEQWSRDGELLSTPVTRPVAYIPGIAVDPRDGTLWVVRQQGSVGYASGLMRLENFDTSGRHLATLDLAWPYEFFQAAGAEFEWVNPN